MKQDLLNELFEYKDGELYWKVSRKNQTAVGEMAGSPHPSGYKKVQIYGKNYRLHRLIFLMHYGYMPKCIDHIDGNTNNNHIENLREVNLSQNQHNRRLNKNSTSGVKGVSWHKANKKWSVQIRVISKLKYIGLFDDLELAELVAIEARNKYHKEFANHG